MLFCLGEEMNIWSGRAGLKVRLRSEVFVCMRLHVILGVKRRNCLSYCRFCSCVV